MGLIPRGGLTPLKDNRIYLKRCSNLSGLHKMGQEISPGPGGTKANLSGAKGKYEHVVQSPRISKWSTTLVAGKSNDG